MKFIVFLILSKFAYSSPCIVTNERDVRLGDALHQIISRPASCPKDILELKKLLALLKINTLSAMVSNRGRNNPTHGSFSIFESAYGTSEEIQIKRGQLFFGYFTKRSGREVKLDITPDSKRLMIEVIAWDPVKQMFNFYELMGQGNTSQWFYRGDSYDAIKDNEFLHRNKVGRKFGHRMRCSACHNSGTPILKEIKAPHNDWWRKNRPLPLQPNTPSKEVRDILINLSDVSFFAKDVIEGSKAFIKSSQYRRMEKSLSLQEALRPLFCTVEINIESAVARPYIGENLIQVPGSVFVNPILSKSQGPFVRKSEYVYQLNQLGFRFPEGAAVDSDQPWLAPVKGLSDLLKIEMLIRNGVLDLKTAKLILSFDFKRPLFSEKRCAMLKYVPNHWDSNWFFTMQSRLSRSQAELGQDFSQHLSQGEKNHSIAIETYLGSIRSLSGTKLRSGLRTLDQIRKSVFHSEISQNPLGQILEPGFRVIFPLIPNR